MLLPPRAVTEIERCRNERNSSHIEIDLTTDDSTSKIIDGADLRVGVTHGVQGRRILRAMRRRLKSKEHPQDIVVLVPDDKE